MLTYFVVVGDFNEEVPQSFEAHADLTDGSVERSTPTRVRSHNDPLTSALNYFNYISKDRTGHTFI